MKPDYTSLNLPPPPPDRPLVLVNMVMSADGKTVFEGNERGLGSPVDQRLMRELRVNADAVLNGAGTLRASGASPQIGDPILEELRRSRGLPATPLGAVLSRSGDLPLDNPFFTSREFEAVLFLSAAAPEQRRRAIEATGRAVVVLPEGDEPGALLRYLRHERGVNTLLVEGGATVNAALFATGAVDQIFLTLGPVIVSGRDRLSAVEGEGFSRAAAPRLRLRAAFPNDETNEVYLRYDVLRG